MEGKGKMTLQDVEGGGTRSQLYGSSVGALLAALGVSFCPVCFGFTMGFTGTALDALTKPPREGGMRLSLSQVIYMATF